LGASGVSAVNSTISILFDGIAYAMFLFIVSVGLSVPMAHLPWRAATWC
jgi:hypothetical protein